MTIEMQLDLCLRIAIAAVLSSLVGFERERQGRPAGLRTHMLVGLGSAMFTVLSIFAFGAGDHARVAAQIVTGVGFLGAGAIFKSGDGRSPKGLTTAAGIWAAAAIGMACGAGAYVVGGFSALLMVFVLAALQRLDDMIRRNTPARQSRDGGDAPTSHHKTEPKE